MNNDVYGANAQSGSRASRRVNSTTPLSARQKTIFPAWENEVKEISFSIYRVEHSKNPISFVSVVVIENTNTHNSENHNKLNRCYGSRGHNWTDASSPTAENRNEDDLYVAGTANASTSEQQLPGQNPPPTTVESTYESRTWAKCLPCTLENDDDVTAFATTVEIP
ncbi:hypothetical protein EVAR_25133_1 [Eumeta japonica]|uniref:Uncharacterized protein n=1 Tax=Eumeta variegata TaxID=151549 RepID=A0A4C1XLV0_EUMVA|nr:hypothetical protein EVAR_25133_1 [Eumeta japonica]